MEGLSTLETLYIGCAILGGVLFAVRVILMFVSGDSDAGGDAGGDPGDAGGAVHTGDIDVNVDHHGGPDVSFRILSLQGLTAFLLMFGLIGLAVLRAFDSKAAGTGISILAGVAAGFGAGWVISRLFSLMGRMQSSGTVNLANAIGQEGTVYLKIPASGTGKVHLAVQGRLMELEAVSEKKVDLASGDRIRVVKLAGESALSVEKI
jgi:membrane protein implicated in regulation of membrane protease activity